MTLFPQDENRLRIILGFTFGIGVLIIYFVLAVSVVWGHITKESSYGLDMVLDALGPLSGMFCGWAFGFAQGYQKGEKKNGEAK